MLVRPLYLRPDLDAEIVRLGLNQADSSLLREFASRGYVVIDPEIPNFESVAQRVIEEVEPLLTSDRDNHPRVHDAWWATPSPLEIASSPRIIEVLRLLYGREPFPFQTLNFPQGTEQSTHSDTIHFDSAPSGFMAGVWVALEDTDAANGPLHYYPGSHRLPQLTLADFGVRGSDNGYNHYKTVYEPGVRHYVEALGLEREEAYLKKGQALIWSANLLHGGSPILDESRTRHSQVTHYYFEDCTYFTPMLSDPMLGRNFIRFPRDIRTRRMVPSRYLGERVRPPFLTRLRERIKGRGRL